MTACSVQRASKNVHRAAPTRIISSEAPSSVHVSVAPRFYWHYKRSQNKRKNGSNPSYFRILTRCFARRNRFALADTFDKKLMLARTKSSCSHARSRAHAERPVERGGDKEWFAVSSRINDDIKSNQNISTWITQKKGLFARGLFLTLCFFFFLEFQWYIGLKPIKTDGKCQRLGCSCHRGWQRRT